MRILPPELVGAKLPRADVSFDAFWVHLHDFACLLFGEELSLGDV
jgi:hypothetical protein